MRSYRLARVGEKKKQWLRMSYHEPGAKAFGYLSMLRKRTKQNHVRISLIPLQQEHFYAFFAFVV